ncbi:hypothetical protein E2C01_014148 [Portunus trituberculatus]|uniref:Uncharacterized protein n=1 Tax=Portunus trituberculatus TaxID=210409 RepID=A0A5B7DJ84_PORTR|nr:hypothetical protein [Portunus trituberculatus]
MCTLYTVPGVSSEKSTSPKVPGARMECPERGSSQGDESMKTGFFFGCTAAAAWCKVRPSNIEGYILFSCGAISEGILPTLFVTTSPTTFSTTTADRLARLCGGCDLPLLKLSPWPAFFKTAEENTVHSHGNK